MRIISSMLNATVKHVVEYTPVASPTIGFINTAI